MAKLVPMPLNGLQKIMIQVLRININIPKLRDKTKQIETNISERGFRDMKWGNKILKTAFMTAEERDWLKDQYELPI